MHALNVVDRYNVVTGQSAAVVTSNTKCGIPRSVDILYIYIIILFIIYA